MLKNTLIITVFVFLGTVLPGLFVLPAIALGVDPTELQGGGFNPSFLNIMTVLAISGGMIAFVYAVQRYFHRGSFWDLGFKKEWVSDMVKGHLIGAVLTSMPIGWFLLQSEDVQVVSSLPDSVGAMTVVGYYIFFLFMLQLNSFKEELLFRSYPIENIEGESISSWTTILIASAIFSVVHLVLEPFTWGAFVYRFLFGVLACQIYVATRSLWMVVGIHSGFNWVSATFSGNWKLGGLLAVTNSDGTEAELSSQTPVIVVLVVAIGVYEWLLRRRAPAEQSTQLPDPR